MTGKSQSKPKTLAEQDAVKHSKDTGSPKPVGESASSRVKSGSKRAVKSSSKSTTAHTGKKASVTLGFNAEQLEVLDNLRDSVSREAYLQRLLNVHLESANPVTSFVEDDDLPGNEREIALITGERPTRRKRVRDDETPGNEQDNFIPGHVPPLTPAEDLDKPGNEQDNFIPQFGG